MSDTTQPMNESAVITQIEANVELIELKGRKFYIVGTAHISRASADLAESTIRAIRPDAVAVELCDSRFQALRDPERWKNTDILKVIRGGRAFLLLAQLMLAAFQKKLGAGFETKPGEEMLRAACTAEEIGVPVVMADREVKTTLKRTWGAVSGLEKIKLLVQFPMKAFSDEKIDPEEVEKLKNRDALDAAMRELSDAYPGIKSALIDERDKYLAAKIFAAPGNTIVAVVGAGHVPGIKNYLGTEIDLAALDALPSKSVAARIISWGIPLIFISLVIFASVHSGSGASVAMAKWWILITGCSAALGAALMLAHPLSILTAFVSAPITTLIHPVFTSGLLAGLVETFLRRPKVSDLETILDDITNVRGIWHNRLSRILLIVTLTNLLGAIGAFIAMGKVAYLTHMLSTQ